MKNNLGIHPVAGTKKTNRKLDVLFIHGLGGDAFSTWQYEDKDEYFWPKGLAGDFPEIGVWTIAYGATPSRWVEDVMAMEDRADNLLNQFVTNGIGKRPFIIVAHSMGGLIAKYIVTQAENSNDPDEQEIANNCRGIVFLAVPHTGSGWSNLLGYANILVRGNNILKQLAKDSSSLRRLDHHFSQLSKRKQLISHAFIETKEVRTQSKMLGFIPISKGIKIVSETSAGATELAKRPVPMDDDHLSICKLTSKEDQLYKNMVMIINGYLAHNSSEETSVSLSKVNYVEEPEFQSPNPNQMSVDKDNTELKEDGQVNLDQNGARKSVNLFISYSHEDEKKYKNELEKCLKAIQRSHSLNYWDDRQMLAGSSVDETILGQLEDADIVVLLISRDFFASDYCFNIEREAALKRCEDKKNIVIPIIIRSTDNWHNFEIGKKTALPRDGKPLSQWNDEDEFWADIQKGIRRQVENLLGENGYLDSGAIEKKKESRFKYTATGVEARRYKHWLYHIMAHDYLGHYDVKEYFKNQYYYVGFYRASSEDEPYSFAVDYYARLMDFSEKQSDEYDNKVVKIGLSGSGKNSFRSGLYKVLLPDIGLQEEEKKKALFDKFRSGTSYVFCVRVSNFYIKNIDEIISGTIDLLKSIETRGGTVSVLFWNTKSTVSAPSVCGDMESLRKLDFDDIDEWIATVGDMDINTHILQQELSVLKGEAKFNYKAALDRLEVLPPEEVLKGKYS